MQTIRNVAKYSLIMTILYEIGFCIISYYKIIEDSNAIAIIINIMTGFLTTASVSLVEYNVKIGDNIKYFTEELIAFYHSLYRLKNCINSEATINEKIEAIEEEFEAINNRALKKKQEIDIIFMFNTKKNKYFCDMINKTYELTFGIDLNYLKLIYKSKKRKTIKIKEKYIKLVSELIEAEFKQINHNLEGLKKYNLFNNWVQLRNHIISIYEKKDETNLVKQEINQLLENSKY